MTYEHVILAVVVAWAVYYLWRTLFRNRGCACGSCPSGVKENCCTPDRGNPAGPPESCGTNKQSNSWRK